MFSIAQDIVYLIGGYDGVSHFNCVRTFDPQTMTWSWKAPMSRARCYVSVVLLDQYIYALGGFDGYTRLSSAERYDPKLNQWEPISDMHLVRSDAAAASELISPVLELNLCRFLTFVYIQL